MEFEDKDLQDENINDQDTHEEQSDEGTPEDDYQYGLDKDGNLVILNADGEEEDDEEEEESDEDSNEEQPDEEEADTDESQTELPIYKVKVNGEEVEVPLDELLAGYSRQSDYTRKMQELAEQRKALATPAPQATPTATKEVPDNTLELAKQIASRRLGLESVDDLSELSFEHNIAVFEAKQALDNQRNQEAQKQQAIANLENDLRLSDPAYNDILNIVGEKIQELPHKEFLKLQQAYESGNPAPLKEFYEEQRKQYYAEKARSSVVPKKVPKVEPATRTPLQRQAKKIDFKSFGKMTSDQKAQMLIDSGIV